MIVPDLRDTLYEIRQVRRLPVSRRNYADPWLLHRSLLLHGSELQHGIRLQRGIRLQHGTWLQHGTGLQQTTRYHLALM